MVQYEKVKYEFWERKDNIAACINQFPNCFDDSFKLVDDAMSILESYPLPKRKGPYRSETDYVECGRYARLYDDMRKMIIAERYHDVKSDISKRILAAYDELIGSIANYHFTSKHENSYGDNQNKTNIEILFDLSMLRPMLIMTLQNLDCMSNRGRVSTELSSHLEDLINGLKQASVHLDLAEVNYHTDGDYLGITEDLDASCMKSGHLKKVWRQARNAACKAILDFYYGILELAVSMPVMYCVNDKDKIALLHRCGVDNIMNGPHSYCFLSPEDREQQSKCGLKRKLRAGYKRHNVSQN